MKRRFAVLDRDGTIIDERQYLSEVKDMKVLPGAVEALRALKRMDLGVIVITNQSGVGRGLFSEERLRELNEYLCGILAAEGVVLDGVYYCPHKPEDRCACRKPEPGLIERAAQELDFEPAQCFVIGDKRSDIDMGRRVRAMTFLVQTGYGADTAAKSNVPADYVVANLPEAAEKIAHILAAADSRES
jgi:D-glycero-D-manno-heptose 1,7-bisphosphate phosphatase